MTLTNAWQKTNNIIRQYYYPVLIFFILALGIFVRFNKIGNDSFWVDEANIAINVAGSSFSYAISTAREHAAAMPLDYVIAWLMARHSVEEGWLRLPSAVWSSATLVVIYLFSRKFIQNRHFQLIPLLLLAVSPMHIYYAQEFRFYASSAFFYLLSTYLMLLVIENDRPYYWLFTGIVILVGSYFHVYVILSLLNGFFFTFLNPSNIFERLQKFIILSVIVVLAVIPGFLIFVNETQFSYGLSISNVITSILIGMDWFPMGIPGLSDIWAGLLLIWLIFLAVYFSIRKKNKTILFLIISMLVQILLIIAGDLLKNYFIDPRQFLILIPLNLMAVAWSAEILFNTSTLPKDDGAFQTKGARLFAWSKQSLIIFVLIVILLSRSQALLDHSENVKSYGRVVSELLSNEWKPGDLVLVIPKYDIYTLQYYLDLRAGNTRVMEAVVPISEDELLHYQYRHSRTFLILGMLACSKEISVQVEALGFQPHALTPPDYAPHVLWIKE